MSKIKPYLIIPNLIEQPTWGGSYITELKKLNGTNSKSGQSAKLTKGLAKLGQSYELYEHTNLSHKLSTEKSPSIELGNPSNPKEAKKLHTEKSLSLQLLTGRDPVKVLGKKAARLMGKSMQVLIKLTQAKGNSYQIHPQKPTGQWFPKPESWYYFEPGLLTLGIKPGTNWNKYKKVCEAINQRAKEISKQIKSKKLSVTEGRKQLASFIKKNNPEQFVNVVQSGKNQVIDLSPCGIHHSWEQDSKRFPQGNILYEVQQNVYDPAATIRSFDQGSIKDDGSIRTIHINDYFKYINRSEKFNDPETYISKGKILKRTSTQTIKQLFDTKNYSLQELKFADKINNNFVRTTDSFHHLFVKEGSIKLTANKQTWTITQGYSIFIPAAVGKYKLTTYKGKRATLLKTYV